VAIDGPDGLGTKSIVDVVINHRCGTNDWGDFSEPHFGGPGVHTPEEIAWANLHAVAVDDEWRQQQDPDLIGRPRSDSCYEQTTAGRHLDHDNPIVASEIKKWLKDYLLDSLGFAGFRYDLATGYPAQCIGRYNDHAQPEMSIGEVWREDAQTLVDWICSTSGESSGRCVADRRPRGKSAAFDFALRVRLWDALRWDDFTGLRTAEGKPPGLVGMWPEMAVTFIENHDTEEVRGNGKAFPREKVLAGHAYVLTHPGKPTVFWSHFFDFGHDEFQQSFEAVISEMIAIRKQNGIHSGSHCEILAAERGLYAAIIDGRVAVKLGSMYPWHPGPGWPEQPVCRGRDFAIWTRGE
jgi:alpha-amylase